MDIISESEVRIKDEYNFGADRVNPAFDAFMLNFNSPTYPLSLSEVVFWKTLN